MPLARIPIWLRCILSGLLLAGAFPHLDWGALAYVALIPFLSTFPYARTRHAAGRGFLCGFAFFGALLYWIVVFCYPKIGLLGVFAWLASAAIQAVFVALFAAGANVAWNRTGSLGRLLVIPSLWVLTEWLRQMGTFGMGWGDLAYSQWHFAFPRSLSPTFGIWGVTWLIVAVNVALVQWRRRSAILIALAVIVVAAYNGLAHNLHKPWSVLGMASPQAHCIQANINQDVPWGGMRPLDSVYYRDTLDTFGTMIGSSKGDPGASLNVIAETGIPGYPDLDPGLKRTMTAWAVDNKTTIVAGARHIDKRSGKDQNVVFMVSPTGQWSAPYAKAKLVPFGEYVPYRRFFPFLEAMHVAVFDMKAGSDNQPPLTAPGSDWKVGPMICYESTYAGFARQQVLRGATTLAIVTDDTWFGKTAAARQHEAMAAFRAAETDRPLVRCGATGISTVFTPWGEDKDELGLFKKGVVTGPLYPETDITPYVRYGDWFVGVCGAMTLLIVGGSYFRRSPRPTKP